MSVSELASEPSSAAAGPHRRDETPVSAFEQTGWSDDGDRPGRIGLFFIGIWTLFMLQPLSTAWGRRDEFAGWAGIVLTLGFTAWYMYVFAIRRVALRRGRLEVEWRSALVKLGIALVLALGLVAAIGQSGDAASVYLTVMCVMAVPMRIGVPLAVANSLAWWGVGVVIAGWHRDDGLLLSNFAAGLAVLGIQFMILRNAELVSAQHENSRLAVSEERNRFARDLHDILGHSLTVITVKAELASRLMDVDPARAKVEVKELERLSRDALADVRRAVEGYRELSLPGELARARAALNAAEIDADLPNSTDEVPGDLRELFAWTIREGVTNVLRHSGARACAVVLEADAVEVRDDGRGLGGAAFGHGNGLTGLRERAAALGATVVTTDLRPGFSLRVVAA